MAPVKKFKRGCSKKVMLQSPAIQFKVLKPGMQRKSGRGKAGERTARKCRRETGKMNRSTVSVTQVSMEIADQTFVEGFGENDPEIQGTIHFCKADLAETDACSGIWTGNKTEIGSEVESFLKMTINSSV